MHAMMSTDTRRYDGHGDAAMREARRVLSVAEADGVHHDILPGLLRYDLQPMRDLCDALSAFLSAPDPAEYLAAVSR